MSGVITNPSQRPRSTAAQRGTSRPRGRGRGGNMGNRGATNRASYPVTDYSAGGRTGGNVARNTTGPQHPGTPGADFISDPIDNEDKELPIIRIKGCVTKALQRYANSHWGPCKLVGEDTLLYSHPLSNCERSLVEDIIVGKLRNVYADKMPHNNPSLVKALLPRLAVLNGITLDPNADLPNDGSFPVFKNLSLATIDIGGCPPRHRARKADFIHSCAPIIDFKDFTRRSGPPGLRECRHRVEDCDCVDPVNYMSVHAYLDPELICLLVNKPPVGVAYVKGGKPFKAFIRRTLFAALHVFGEQQNGTMFALDNDEPFESMSPDAPEAKWERIGKDIVMHVRGNNAPYRHPAPDWIKGRLYYSERLDCAMVWEIAQVVNHTTIFRFSPIFESPNGLSKREYCLQQMAYLNTIEASPVVKDPEVVVVDTVDMHGEQYYRFKRGSKQFMVYRRSYDDLSREVLYRPRDSDTLQRLCAVARRKLPPELDASEVSIVIQQIMSSNVDEEVGLLSRLGLYVQSFKGHRSLLKLPETVRVNTRSLWFMFLVYYILMVTFGNVLLTVVYTCFLLYAYFYFLEARTQTAYKVPVSGMIEWIFGFRLSVYFAPIFEETVKVYLGVFLAALNVIGAQLGYNHQYPTVVSHVLASLAFGIFEFTTRPPVPGKLQYFPLVLHLLTGLGGVGRSGARIAFHSAYNVLCFVMFTSIVFAPTAVNGFPTACALDGGSLPSVPGDNPLFSPLQPLQFTDVCFADHADLTRSPFVKTYGGDEYCKPKVSLTMVGPVPSGLRPIVYRNCTHNELSAIHMRHYLKDPHVAKSQPWAELLEWRDVIVAGSEVDQLVPYRFFNWVMRFEPPKRIKLALEYARSWGTVTDADFRIDAFIKREKQHLIDCYGWVKGVKPPRLIQAMTTRVQNATGRVVLAYSKFLMQWYSLTNEAWPIHNVKVIYAGGLTSEGLGAAYRDAVEWVGGSNDSVTAIVLDFEKFDSHQGRASFQQFETPIYIRLGKHMMSKPLDYALSIMSEELTTGCTKTGVKFKGTVRGGPSYGYRNSGSNKTSTGNSEKAICALTYALNGTIGHFEHGHRAVVVNAGDDNVVLVNTKDAVVVSKDIDSLLSRLVLPATKEFTTPEMAEFCSGFFVPVNGQLVHTRKPGKALKSLFWGLGAFTGNDVLAQARSLALSASIQVGHMPVVRVFIEKVLEYTVDVAPARQRRKDQSSILAERSHSAGEDTFRWLADAINVEVSELWLAEDWLRVNISSLVGEVNHPIVRRLCDLLG